MNKTIPLSFDIATIIAFLLIIAVMVAIFIAVLFGSRRNNMPYGTLWGIGSALFPIPVGFIWLVVLFSRSKQN